MLDDAQLGPLLVGEGVDDPGDLDQMGLVVAGQRVELAGDQEPRRLIVRCRPTSAIEVRLKQVGRRRNDR